MKRTLFGVVLAGLFVLLATPAAAQIYITPAAGVFIPASDLEDLEGQAEATRLSRSGAALQIGQVSARASSTGLRRICKRWCAAMDGLVTSWRCPPICISQDS
jgi:hypothetical protein